MSPARREKLRMMAAQAASPREAAVAREILSKSPGPLAAAQGLPSVLEYVGRGARGAPHYQQRPRPATDGECEQLPGAWRAPRPLARRGAT